MPAEIGQLYGRAGAVELTKEFLSGPHRDGRGPPTAAARCLVYERPAPIGQAAR